MLNGTRAQRLIGITAEIASHLKAPSISRQTVLNALSASPLKSLRSQQRSRTKHARAQRLIGITAEIARHGKDLEGRVIFRAQRLIGITAEIARVTLNLVFAPRMCSTPYRHHR